ncbi:MAG: hypothetical protein J6B64_00510 [Bacilli bacterium]|nr:hypothetical protein [Bacilli bacterium]MBP3635614.1 hypothetical protein [Bacilli bacterium]
MKINKQEIDKYIQSTINDNKFNKINNIYLSNRQVRILNKYNIGYQNVIDIRQLIFKVEEFINENYLCQDMEDLENLSQELAEFNYYYNTNK